jgi:phosphonopyruvate decarboxylase
MTGASGLVSALDDIGVGLVAGVPCSYLAGPIQLLEEHPRIRYVPAVNEGSAVAVAAGARLAGTSAAIIAQNSGFGNMINPLTSLVLPYRIGLLAIVSLRGWPTADPGEPQHLWMGRVIPSWLESMGISYRIATAGGRRAVELLDELRPVLAERRPAFLLVGKGAIGSATTADPMRAASRPRLSADDALPPSENLPTREDLVEAVAAELSDELVLSTTGYLSRTLFERADRPKNLYMQGSMGHVSSLALGAALARPDLSFVVLDGDGSVLMHMGSLASIGHYAPARFLHLVFDNGGYESTGGQPTAAEATDYCAVALAAGYRSAHSVDSVSALRLAIRDALRCSGPTLLVVTGRAGALPSGRASEEIPVDRLAERFEAAFGAVSATSAGTVPATSAGVTA